MPDWRIPEDYSFTADLNGEQWAWEFLRRNPDYKDDYEASFEPDRLWLDAPRSRLNEHAIFIPPKFDDETPLEWQRRTILAGTSSPLAYRPARYYGLHWPIAENIKAPSDNEPPLFLPAYEYPRLLDYSDIDSLFTFPGEAPESAHQEGAVAIVCLHLGKPIESQLEKVRRIYQRENESRNVEADEGTRLNVGRWTNYLRILDAKSADVTARDICLNVFPEYQADHTSMDMDKEISRQFSKIKFLYSPEGIYAILKAFADSNRVTR
jgi:hypothetical protein